jgi:hypothetical protein
MLGGGNHRTVFFRFSCPGSFAHSQALIEALEFKQLELVLEYEDKCTVLARAKSFGAMERVVQIKVRGIERYGDRGKGERRGAGAGT